MSDAAISWCAPEDLPEVVDLVNAAYRGEGGRSGWTSEIGLVNGQRITLALLRAEMAGSDGSRIGLLREGPRLLACVRIEDAALRSGERACYISMLAVHPAQQNAGVGRRMLAWAEEQGRGRGARVARMTVVSARAALIAWYERCGYHRTGETEPFPYEDERFGKPLRAGLEFVFLQKELSP